MILRRVIEHVKAQNWTAVALDFVIVVVGVFIGIQVSNWNDALGDRIRGNAYLQRIAEDLEADLALYSDRFDFWARTSDYGRTGLAHAARDKAGDLTQWQLLLAYFQASQVAEVFTNRTTYDELTSAGELGLIGDPALRSRLANYYTNAVNPTLTARPAYREHVRERIPIDIQTYIWRNCYGSTPSGGQKYLDCDSPVDEARAAEIVDNIRNDDALMGELTYWLSTLEVATLIAQSQANLATDLRETALALAGASATHAVGEAK